MMKRNPKVKVDKVDLKTFLYEQLTVDPFWDDVYNPPQRECKKLKRLKNQ